MRVGEKPLGGPSLSSQPGGSRHSGAARTEQVWQGSRAGFLSAARLALIRLARGRALLAMVGIGILVAVVLICVVPLYTLLGEDVQIQNALNADTFVESTAIQDSTVVSGVTHNIAIQASGSISPSLVGAAQPVVARIQRQYLAGITTATPTYYLESDAVILTQAGSASYNPSGASTPESTFAAFDFSAIAPHLRVLAGTLPTASGTGCVIDAEMASQQHLHVGDTLTWVPFGLHSLTTSLRIDAIVTQSAANDSFWNGLTLQPAAAAFRPVIYPVLVTQSQFFKTLQPFAPADMSMSQNWIYYTRPSAVTAGNANDIVNNLAETTTSLAGQLSSVGQFAKVTVDTTLGSTLKDIQQQRGLLALPLYIIVAQVLGLALLFVVVMAGLLIEGQASDISTLKSRGASGVQLLSIYVTQGLILGIICLIVGPLVSSALALLLIKRFVSSASSVSASYLAHVATPGTVLIPALVGVGLGGLMIALAAFQSARLDVLAFRLEQARPSRAPFWQRYYLDLALVILCVIGYFELGQFGGAATREQLGGGANPLLLLTPAFLLLGGALLVLRLVPAVAAMGARLAARGRGISSLLALAQIERTPGRYARMTLLLVLAVGLGLFALTFNASLAQNIRDHTTYSIGADLVVTLGNDHPLSPHQSSLYDSLPGVLGKTMVVRSQGFVNPAQNNYGSSVLGVDPDTFASVVGATSWRSDYASVPLTTLMAELKQHTAGPSAGTPGHPIWAIVSQATAQSEHLSIGSIFAAQFAQGAGGPASLVVGAIVPAFPTLYPSALPDGFFVVSASDYANAVEAGQGQANPVYPNEIWFHTSENSTIDAKLTQQLSAEEGDLGNYVGYSDVWQALEKSENNPIAEGMRGLLLIGALTAAGLAILGSLVQGILAANQRMLQFAILRTIGMSSRQILGQLLGEQIVVYFFGLVGGTALGLLLTTATLPFLQFSEGSVDPVTLGVPPYIVLFDGRGLAAFYVALLIAVAVALAIAGRYASAIGLGKALRLGAD